MTTPANAALDTETLDRIANLLGNADEWSPASDYLEEIANAIATATACIARIEQKRNPCTVCGTLIDPFAEFPGTRCLDCYAASADGNRHISARELAQMWGAR